MNVANGLQIKVVAVRQVLDRSIIAMMKVHLGPRVGFRGLMTNN
jgi:hypothetical protein